MSSSWRYSSRWRWSWPVYTCADFPQNEYRPNCCCFFHDRLSIRTTHVCQRSGSKQRSTWSRWSHVCRRSCTNLNWRPSTSTMTSLRSTQNSHPKMAPRWFMWPSWLQCDTSTSNGSRGVMWCTGDTWGNRGLMWHACIYVYICVHHCLCVHMYSVCVCVCVSSSSSSIP